jgi:hypothetical protein
MNKLPNITLLTSEEYAKELIDKYISTIKQGVSRNFIHHYARECALEDITNSIQLMKELSPGHLGLDVNIRIMNEVKDIIKKYKF